MLEVSGESEGLGKPRTVVIRVGLQDLMANRKASDEYRHSRTVGRHAGDRT